jgi:mannose-6-phosphate isomerase
MQPILLGPNLPETFYRGSGRLAAFRGLELAPRPEDWVASLTTRFGQKSAGLAALEDGRLLSELIAEDPESWFGAADSDAALLVKLLDAGQRLPVHVHPNRPFAQSHLASPYGKTEAWIVLDAAEDAGVHLGFARDIDPDELSRWVREQDVGALLGATNRIPVAAGDAILCPAGMPHAIDKDVLLIELQEPTDFSVLLEWKGFPLSPDDAMLGLPFDEALGCVDRRACTPERITSLRTAAAGSLLPAEAAEFFRAQTLAAGPLPAGFSVLVITHGAGELTGDWGSLAIGRGATVVVPHAARCEVAGNVSGVQCRPAG